MAQRRVCRKNEDLGGCTCDGGPYTHGPEGQAEVLAKLKKEEQKNESDTSVRETRSSGA